MKKRGKKNSALYSTYTLPQCYNSNLLLLLHSTVGGEPQMRAEKRCRDDLLLFRLVKGKLEILIIGYMRAKTEPVEKQHNCTFVEVFHFKPGNRKKNRGK